MVQLLPRSILCNDFNKLISGVVSEIEGDVEEGVGVGALRFLYEGLEKGGGSQKLSHYQTTLGPPTFNNEFGSNVYVAIGGQ